jgi:ketosteroid isomerase-like protein
LKFEEQTPLAALGWTIAGPADRWVLVAADDAELSELLAQTAVWEHPEAPHEQQEVPPVPEGQTALVYFVGYRQDGAVRDSTVGVYESDGDWVVAVRRTRDAGLGTQAIIYERHLVFVDAPPPNSVRLRFESARVEPAEVTWW